MKLTTFAAGFLAICVAIVVVMLVLNRPASEPNIFASPGPTAPPSSWPDYSVNGPGFIRPVMPDGDLIAHGYKLVSQTYALIGPEVPAPGMRFAGNNLACQNCHLDGGTKRSALPLVGVFRTYPKFSARSGRTISLAERVDECMTRSMNGRKLPDGSREMAAFLAYMRFIGEPAPIKSEPAPPAPQEASAVRGAEVFGRVCAVCHQPDGLGRRRGSATSTLGYEFPPLWGPDSFNDGAGMDHFERAVGFIRHNMPRGVDPAHPQLSLQDAWDLTALLQSKPRARYEAAR
jgi:thiosulfate dehydrogenase